MLRLVAVSALRHPLKLTFALKLHTNNLYYYLSHGSLYSRYRLISTQVYLDKTQGTETDTNILLLSGTIFRLIGVNSQLKVDAKRVSINEF